MKNPLIRKPASRRNPERGVTMALVALAMLAIIGIAALSIDLVTLFLAREEAQRAADAGALAAARTMSILGLTGDSTDGSGTWACICGTPTNCTIGTTPTVGFATMAAERVAGQSTVSGLGDNPSNSPFTVSVTYSAGNASSPDCTLFTGAAAGAFGVNPMVTVQVTRSSLPTFFSRIWGNAGNTVSASATAEAYNPSFSAGNGNSGATGTITPVQPRCVKPLFVPNEDPRHGSNCTGTGCANFVSPANGNIVNPGVSLDGTGTSGVIGENFILVPDCKHGGFGFGGYCSLIIQPEANAPAYGPFSPGPSNLQYVPGAAPSAVVAVPSAAAAGHLFEQAIAGCDQTTVYQCGVANANAVDLSENPYNPTGSGPTLNGFSALIHEGGPNNPQPDGQDYFNTPNVFGSVPVQILAGTANPLVGANFSSGSPISASTSIVTLPIYDSNNTINNNGSTTAVTVVGFLQLFVNSVDRYGNVNVTIMNVAGCSNGSGPTVGSPVTGSSPVPIRLITPPPPPPS